MGNGEIWGIGGVGNLHDIFHQLLICPVDALLDLGLRDQIERDLGVSRVFGLAGSVWKGMGSEGVLMFSVWQFAVWNGIWGFSCFRSGSLLHGMGSGCFSCFRSGGSVWKGMGSGGFLVFSVWRFCALICPVYAFLYLGLRANTERFWTIFPVHRSMRSPLEKTVLH